MQRKIGIYCRSATSEVLVGTHSRQIAAQCSQLLGLVEKINQSTPGWGEVIEVYVDDGVSGLHLDRPALSKLRSDIAGGTINTVLVADNSRLSRSVQTSIVLRDEFTRANVELIEATDLERKGPRPSLTSDRFAKLGELFPPKFMRTEA